MARRFRAAALALLSLALLGAVDPAQANAGEAPPLHFLWKVSGGQGVVYLFGTIHVGRGDFYPLPQIVEDSFRQADTLVEEVRPADTADPHLKQLLVGEGSYPAGDTLANHLSEETRARLASYLRECGQSDAVVAHLRPWAVAILVAELAARRQGLDPAQGLDVHFVDEADRLDKPVEGLETPASQLKLFSALPPELADQLLLSSLIEADKPKSVLDDLVAAWRTGDAEKMQGILTLTTSAYPQLKAIDKTVIYDRNDAMAGQIVGFLNTPKTYFVAVGALHLVGEHGILNLLRNRQFAVDQL